MQKGVMSIDDVSYRWFWVLRLLVLTVSLPARLFRFARYKVFHRQQVILIGLLLASVHSISQQVEWTQRLGSTNNFYVSPDKISDVEYGEDGVIFITGEFGASNILVRDDSLDFGATNESGAFVAQLSSSGELNWLEYLFDPNSFSGSGHRLAVDHSGNAIVGCIVHGDFTLGSTVFTSVPIRSYLLFKLDPQGQLLWHHLFTGSSNWFYNRYIGLETTDNNEIIVSGLFQDSITIDSATIIEPAFSGSSNATFIVKLDSTGNLVWQNSIQGINPPSFTGAEVGGDIALDEDGNIYIMSVGDSLIFEPGVTLPSTSIIGWNYVASYDPNGSFRWRKRLGFGNIGQLREHGIDYFDDHLYFYTVAGAGAFYEDTLVIDSVGGTIGTAFGEMDTSGSITYIETTGNLSTTSSYITGIDHSDEEVYLLGRATNSFELGNISESFVNSFEAPLVLSFSPSSQSFKLDLITVPGSGPASAEALAVDSAGNYLAGGYFNGITLGIDTFQLDRLGQWDAFLIKKRSCNHLSGIVSTISGDSLLCNNQSVGIQVATTGQNINYQWKFGASIIPTANDSTFNASLPGSYSVIISDSNCQVFSDSITIVNGTTIPTSFTPSQTQFCESDPVIVLSGGNPTGGSYAGTGVSAGVFDPGAAGPGNHSISYIFTQPSGCVDTLTQTFNVLSEPGAFFFPSIDTVCEGQTLTLTGGFPSGGQYSGSGVTGNQFNTTTAGTGSHTLYYSRTNGSCASIDSIAVFVESTPSVTLNLGTTQTCEAASPLALSGGSPTGGTYSGSGVSGGFFIPGILAPGTYSISYSVSASGCAASASANLTVDSFPVVTLPAFDSVCLSATSLDLNHGLPVGGTYLGAGVSGNTFDAGSVGIGGHPIQYVITNACASDTATSNINVIANPSITASITDVSCPGDANGTLDALVTGSNASFSFAWSTGDSVASITSLLAGTYTVTATGGQGCAASNAFTVAEPSALTITLDSVSDVVCNGFNNGEAFTSISGGTSPYTALWSTGSALQDPLDLPEGTHQLLVTDANGCSDSLDVTITELDPVISVLSVQGINCFGASNASIDVQASGGGGTYSYAWNMGSTDSFLLSLDTGTYISTVSDANGCFRMDTVVLSQPDSLSLGSAATDVSCFGGSDGSIALTAVGGIEPYQYAWNTGANASNLGSLAAGNYAVTVTDSNGCSAVQSDTIHQPDSLFATISIIDSIACNGDSNGAMQVLVTGGSAPYSFLWNTGDTVSMIDSISAGSYSVTITDSAGCIATQSTLLSEPDLVQVQFTSVTNPSCFGAMDGTITALASGGTGAFNYTWNTSASGAILNGLSIGSYTVTVSDEQACIDSLTVTLSEPAEIVVSTTGTNLVCFEDSSGAVTTSVSGGIGALSYVWSNGALTPSIDSLLAGAYQVTVTDSNGCVGTSDTTAIIQPDAIALSATVSTVQCAGDSTGSITVLATGGSGGYGFNWSNAVNSNLNLNLPAGTYTLTVTDANGCTKDSVWTLADPQALVLIVDSVSDPLCFDEASGVLGVSAFGGTGAFSYLWNDAGVDSLRTALVSGTYTVTISDANGCEVDTSLVLSDPALLGLSIDSLENLLCFEDSTGYIEVSASGGTGTLIYAWNDGSTSTMRPNLPAGTFSVTVTDANGCDTSISQQLFQPAELIIATNIVTPLCDNTADGFIGLNPQGGTLPYTYAWNTGDSTAALQDLDTGLYLVTVTDVNNCEFIESFDLFPDHLAPVFYFPSDTSFCADTSLTLTIPVNGAIDYSWSTGAITQSILVNSSGSYLFDVLDSNGCFASDSVTVSKDSLPTFSLGNDSLLCVKELADGLTLTGPAGMASYAWSTGATTETEDIFDIGTYGLLVTDSNGCLWMDSIAFVGDTCLGFKEISLSRISVYPNPNDGRFFVSITEGSVELASLKLFSGSGRLVMEASGLQAGSTYAYDRELLPAGVYILRIERGERKEFRRIVVW